MTRRVSISTLALAGGLLAIAVTAVPAQAQRYRSDAEYCDVMARDEARRESRATSGAGALGGAARGAVGGAVMSGILGGNARRGARTGAAIGAISGSVRRSRDYDAIYRYTYDDCMRGYRRR